MLVKEKQPFVHELKRAEACRRMWGSSEVRALGRGEGQGNLSSAESSELFDKALSTFLNDCGWYGMCNFQVQSIPGMQN